MYPTKTILTAYLTVARMLPRFVLKDSSFYIGIDVPKSDYY